MNRVAALACVALLAVAGNANAGEPWLAPGNVQARHDVELLVDEGVLDLPMSSWPIAVSDLAAALAKVKESSSSGASPAPAVAEEVGQGLPEDSRTLAETAALARLRRIAEEGYPTLASEIRAAVNPPVLRGFTDDPREEGELTAMASGFVGERWGGRLELSAVANPEDNKSVRLDGSYVAGIFGNWIVTLGQQDRWWGSGWEGSLILSSNARPLPAIALDRAVSMPFETKWLSWLGPWRLTSFMGYMDGNRHDYNHPLLWGLRASARPARGLEISLERVAMWCGEGRNCSWNEFWKSVTGNDTPPAGSNTKTEAGDQLGGWDVRWASPLGHAPYAVYWQHTGETIRRNPPRPYRNLDIYGVEVWSAKATDGSSWRAGLESAGTKCDGTNEGRPNWDCAYNHHIYTDGYRYYRRPIGHAMDGDGRMYSARVIRVDPAGAALTGIVRYTQLNRGTLGTVPEPSNLNSVAHGPENWWSADVNYRLPLKSGWIEAGAGCDYKDRQWKGTTATEPRLSLTWHHEFH